MKYDLMLIGPATRDVNIDYTGKEVHEIGGAVFLCSAAAKAAGANLFASVKIHPDDTDIIDAFKLDSDHVAILPSETTTLMQNTYFTADRERRKAECLAQSGPIIISIGLILAPSAITNCQSNWLLAFVALGTVIVHRISCSHHSSKGYGARFDFIYERARHILSTAV